MDVADLVHVGVVQEDEVEAVQEVRGGVADDLLEDVQVDRVHVVVVDALFWENAIELYIAATPIVQRSP